LANDTKSAQLISIAVKWTHQIRSHWVESSKV